MLFAWNRLAALARAVPFAALLALGAACSADSAISPDGGTVSATITFDVAGGVLTAAPGEIVSVSLTASSGATNVALALDGAYGDGSLDRTSVRTDDAGHGEFKLRAPTTPATFSLQASAGSARARLDVSVSKDGFATVRVTPSYKGKRPVSIVAASTFLQAKCSDLGSFPAKDGAPLIVGTSGETLVVPKVPAGSKLAVAVRIARYATGCVDLDSLAPGSLRDVTVPLFDVPLAVGSLAVEAGFTLELTPKDRSSLTSSLGASATQALAAFFPDAEAKRLLDAMADATANPNDKGAFAAKRTQASWDATTTTWLGAKPPTLQARATSWLNAAAPKVAGDLRGHLVGTAADKATFTPTLLGSLDATTIALSNGPFTIAADTDDTLKLTGGVTLFPSRLLASGAAAEAKLDFPASTSVPSALALAIDCNGLGSALASGAYAFGTCDATCVAGLCKKALETRWEACGAFSEKQGMKLDVQLTASASTQFDDFAVPQTYSGTWVGQLASGIPAKGNATGVPLPPK